MGRVHGLLAGRERDDEVCSREESVEPSLLRESGRDLPGGVRSDLQGRLDVVDRDDLVALSGKPRGADFPELRAPADYFAFVLWFPHLRFVHRIYNRTDLSVVPPLADGPNPVN